MTTKTTARGERIYSTEPMPESLKAVIRDKFGTIMDGKYHSVWDTYSLTDPEYIGITCIGAVPIPIKGDLEKYYKLHLHIKSGIIEYEVYAFNESPFRLPDDVIEMMANSSIYGGSIKTDGSFFPSEWTAYYHKKQCVADEYAKLRERVEAPHSNGYIIAIKKNNSGYSFEEYGNDK